MPDTGPSRVLSLTTPTTLDLDQDTVSVLFAATVEDPDGIRQVTVYYDRPLATTQGAYEFQIIHGYGNDWSDGTHSYTTSVLPHNIAGPLNITRVAITDNLGNRTDVTAAQLQALGIDTSIQINSTSADTTAPVLTSLELPDVIDLRGGNVAADFSASGIDGTEIDHVTLWFDRDISYSFGSGSFNDWDLLIIDGYSSSNDWSDDNSTQTRTIGGTTYSGPVDLERIWITDIYGNRRIYTNDELRALGFDTSFEIIGTAAPAPTTYVADLPDSITIREGQSVDLALNFIGMTNHYVNYSYYVSTSGGTADFGDIGASSGSGWISIASTSPYNTSRGMSIYALRDGVQDPGEVAYLVVELTGQMRFADGGTTQIVEIRIADDNWSIGNAGANVLRGTSAAEDLIGYAGNDSYHVTAGDRVIEAADAGIDTVFSDFTRGLENQIENLTLTGTAAINGAGNALANRLQGNAAGNTLNGNGGNDTLTGGAGNDRLLGGAGADSMAGGTGNDFYQVIEALDLVVEAAGQGNDTVQSAVSYTLTANVENLVLAGTASISGTGNALANSLTGNAGANLLGGAAGADTLLGAAGNDTLLGGLGADRMSGGNGDDLYEVDNAGDLVIEIGGQGTDRVMASVSHVLAGAVENLTLTGSGNIAGTGNALANIILGNTGGNRLAGNAGNDRLDGGAGNDRLLGGLGADRLIGGLGADQFVFETPRDSGLDAAARDLILDFNRSQGDRIDLRGIDANNALTGDQAFRLIGSGAFTGTAGELRYQQANGVTTISADVNGDGRADFALDLTGAHALVTADFLL